MPRDLPDLRDNAWVLENVRSALKEDTMPGGDVTTAALVPDDAVGRAHIVSREGCVVSGTTVAEMVFHEVDQSLNVTIAITDGATACEGDVILEVSGKSASILMAERTALNFMQRMTGIATRTAQFVAAASESGMMILDTRKTTPGLRIIEKYSVLCGGGANHRFGLFDRVLIKDNHRKLWGGASLGSAVRAARGRYPQIEVEIEVESTAELIDALAGGPDWVLLDNMSPATMRECVSIANGACRLEASGGIGLEDIAAVADTGVDAVSLGCLTHTVRSSDLSLEFI